MQQHENLSSARRWTVILAVAAGSTLLTAACGGGTSTGAAGSSASPAATSPAELALAYARCMRSHGVRSYPDPTTNGNSASGHANLGDLGVSQSVLQAAQNACRSLSPQNFVPPGASQAQNAAQGVKYAQCVRKHGVPDFPDPSSNGTFHVSPGVDLQGPAYQAASNACRPVKPHSLFIDQGPSS